MNIDIAPRFRLAATALALHAVLLGGCTTTWDNLFGGSGVDYRGNASASTKPLEVPPDLTQLARESRYQPQGGVVSAAAAGAAPSPAAAAAATVALNNAGAVRIERDGQQRWLVVPQSPEQLWPQVTGFWESRGFKLDENNPQVGVMETAWAENKAKAPADFIRNTIGKAFPSIFDTGERDRYRTRIERGANGGSEIYISHRGIEEQYTSPLKENTVWRARPNDPQLEAEFLGRLMLALTGSGDAPARAAVTSAAASAATAPDLGKAQVRPGATATSLVVEEPFDRAWRRVGLALDRGGFTVEDRDRAAGLYYVRYVDPKNAGKEEPGWWARLFGDKSNPNQALRYRIAVKAAGNQTNVSVQKSTGEPETGENAQRIMALLSSDLR